MRSLGRRRKMEKKEDERKMEKGETQVEFKKYKN